VQPATRRFTGIPRLTRALVLGSAVLLLTVAGHTAGSGFSAPHLTSLFILLPLAVTLSLVAAERRRSTVWLFGYALAVQVLFHALLSVMSGHSTHAASAVPSVAMVLGHVVAAAFMAAVLATGDAILHRWMGFIRCLAGKPRILPSVPVARQPIRIWIARVVPPRSAVRTTIHRRGPPAFAI
jgi:hypothetical protein